MDHSDLELRPVLARPSLREYIAEIWKRRDFLVAVPRNDLRAAKLDTALGNLWYFVNPALQSTVYVLIFGLLLKSDRGVDNYPAFVVIGVLTFNLLTQSAINATRVVYGNLYLIRSIYFPRAIVPLTSALTNLYMFVPALVVMAGLVLLTGELPTWRWALIPVVMAMLAIMTIGVVFGAARAGYEIPDLHSLLPHLLRLLFYGSGVLFDPAAVTSNRALLLVFNINPFFEMTSLMRWSLTGRPVDGWIWAAASGWAAVAFIFGFIYFWRAEISYGGVQ
jgi:teichoic acid transport system permease protein